MLSISSSSFKKFIPCVTASILCLVCTTAPADADLPVISVTVGNSKIGGSTSCTASLSSFADSISTENVTIYGPGANGFPVEDFQSYPFKSPETGPGTYTETFNFAFTNMVFGDTYTADWYLSGVTDGLFPIIPPGFYSLNAKQKFQLYIK